MHEHSMSKTFDELTVGFIGKALAGKGERLEGKTLRAICQIRQSFPPLNFCAI